MVNRNQESEESKVHTPSYMIGCGYFGLSFIRPRPSPPESLAAIVVRIRRIIRGLRSGCLILYKTGSRIGQLWTSLDHEQHVVHQAHYQRHERPHRTPLLGARPSMGPTIRNLDQGTCTTESLDGWTGSVRCVSPKKRQYEQCGSLYAYRASRSEAGSVSEEGVADRDGVVWEASKRESSDGKSGIGC